MTKEIETLSVVIVGAGPAGIVGSLELARHGINVVLLESGRDRYSESIQKLSELDEFDPDRQAPMNIAARRQFGGASVIWGGRCVPYDPIDFRSRPYIPHSDWPIRFDDVQKYHVLASHYLRCGSNVFSTHGISSIGQKSITPRLHDDEVLSSDLERWSLPTNFGREYRNEIEREPKIKHLAGHTATKVRMTENGEVDSIEGVTDSGEAFCVRGSTYILACGGLETTRLLLQPSEQFPRGIGNQGDWLGRCYMGHISGQIASIQFRGNPKQTQFNFLRDIDGVYLRQRFTFSEKAQLENEINNIAIWLVNPKLGDPRHGNGVLSFAYLALRSPLGKFFAPEAIRLAAIADSKGSIWSHFGNMIRQSPRIAAFIPTFGVKRFFLRRRIPGFFQYSSSNQYPLHYHGEQIPLRQSRVSLSSRQDRLGVYKLNVDLRFADQDVRSVIRAHEMLDANIRKQDAGELKYHTDDIEQSVWHQAQDGFHQAGTTRMAKSAENGVVDENCRVFGTKNLFVASSSTFTTSGQANSTFLIVALAIRLAEHLATGKARSSGE